jgi:pyridoxine 5-phosphate synthase
MKGAGLAKLSVNIDHVASLRQARRGREPEPLAAAYLVTLAGADGVTVHLREDRRHIQDRDLRLIKEAVDNRLNLEMAATEEMLAIAREIQPDSVTLVPEKREELTTEGGLNVAGQQSMLRDYLGRLKKAELAVYLFVDPDCHQVEAARDVNAHGVEVHTGSFADAVGSAQERELNKVVDAVKKGRELDLVIHAGHGINYQNIKLLRQIQDIEEFSIGHSIISRAVLVGLKRAVREMIELLRG